MLRSSLIAAVALLAFVCLCVVPSSAQTCTGSSVSFGPAIVPSYNTYSGPSQLVASQRTLNVTTQVTSLYMFLYYTVNQNQTEPIDVSFALYGAPTCGGNGDSVLLATTIVYALPAGTFNATTGVELTLPLTSPIIVPPGTYFVSMDDTSVFLDPLFGAAPGANVLADAYTFNNFDLTAPVSFPNVTLFDAIFTDVDTAAAIIGTSCINGETVSPQPTCSPRAFYSFPSGYGAASLPCAAASQLVTNTYNFSVYDHQASLATDVPRLIPTYVSTTQTIYAISFLAHPQTSPTTNFTMRPAIYTQGANSTTFDLLAQAAQTTIPGATLSGQFTYLYFPLLAPVTVTGGSTIYLNRLVDQGGLVLVFDNTGTSLTGSMYVNSSEMAPAMLFTTGTGGIDASRGLLGCAAAQPGGSSSGAVVPSTAATVATAAPSSAPTAPSAPTAAPSSAATAPSAAPAATSGTATIVFVTSATGNPSQNPGNSAAAGATSGVIGLALAIAALSMLIL